MTPQKRRLNKVRKLARKELRLLLRTQRYRCYWCGELIINLQAINKSRRRRVTGLFVSYEHQGIMHKIALASVDHLLPLRDGGTNDIDNLVAACTHCNSQRKSGSILKQRKATPLVGHIGEIQRAAVVGGMNELRNK